MGCIDKEHPKGNSNYVCKGCVDSKKNCIYCTDCPHCPVDAKHKVRYVNYDPLDSVIRNPSRCCGSCYHSNGKSHTPDCAKAYKALRKEKGYEGDPPLTNPLVFAAEPSEWPQIP